jgi:hypothetical protein
VTAVLVDLSSTTVGPVTTPDEGLAEIEIRRVVLDPLADDRLGIYGRKWLSTHRSATTRV